MDISNYPMSLLEDTTRLKQTSPERLSTAYGHRWNVCFLKRMQMRALVVYDGDSKILAVVSAMFRMKVSDTQDEVVAVTPEMVVAGMKAGKRPDATVTVLDGDAARQDYVVKLTEIQWLSAYMGRLLPAAAGWGILTGYVDPVKAMKDGLPNSKSREEYLDPRTWKEVDGVVVPGSGGSDLPTRLAPGAREFAEDHVTAWDPFLAGGPLFAGFDKKTMPKIIGAPPVLVRACVMEGERRKAAIAKRDIAWAAQRPGRRGSSAVDAREMFEGSIAAAFDAAKEDGAA